MWCSRRVTAHFVASSLPRPSRKVKASDDPESLSNFLPSPELIADFTAERVRFDVVGLGAFLGAAFGALAFLFAAGMRKTLGKTGFGGGGGGGG